MPEPSDVLAELQRDIAAARADLNGRRDQAIADFNERLAALTSLMSEVEAGSLELRAAQARLRQLVSERAGGIAGKAVGIRTARGTVPGGGATRPTVTPPVAPSRVGTSPQLASALIAKGLSTIDERIVAVMTQPEPGGLREARLELALLLQVRRALAAHGENLPNDAVLLESVIAYAEDAQAIALDLDGEVAERAKRWLDYIRLLVAQLGVFGVSVAELKREVKRLRDGLGSGSAALVADVLAFYERVDGELGRHAPPAAGTLLERLVQQR